MNHDRFGLRVRVLTCLGVLALLAAGCSDGSSGTDIATTGDGVSSAAADQTDDSGDSEPSDDTETADSDDTETAEAEQAAADAGCFGPTAQSEITGAADADIAGVELTLITHDSFALSSETLAAFEDETGASVKVLEGGDAGAMLSQVILTKDDPIADVLFGVDNTFLCRALSEDIFLPYQPQATLLDGLLTDPAHRVAPVDYGDVCANYVIGGSEGADPTTFEDLATPEFAGQLAVENPESSSPGLAFLLATIAHFGEDGWEEYWSALAANDVSISSGWSEAYYEEFSHYGGDRPVVVSYASSPVAEVIYAEPVPDVSPTGVMTATCFRQYEYAGVLSGTEQPEAAAQLVDFLLSDTVQEDIPLNMFVFPTSATATVPADFVTHAVLPDTPLTLDPDLIAAKRDEWTARWVELVLR